jgi:uncharacterized protein (DUF433 family)
MATALVDTGSRMDEVIFEEFKGTLSPGEKARLLQKLAGQIGGVVPGIDTDPAVCGGEACIARRRIPVWLLVRVRQLGASEASLLAAYPTAVLDRRAPTPAAESPDA